MSTCATCRHRGNEPLESERWDDNDKLTVNTYYECKRATHDTLPEYTPGQQMLVIDGSGYFAQLCVELTFGCNQWEQRT